MPFDGIVTRAVTGELAEMLTGGRINKIYQPSPTEIVLQIRAKGKNRNMVVSVHSNYARLHLTGDKFANPQEPPMFCMVLRKHLTGAVIQEIRQFGMERIVTMEMQARNEIGDISTRQLNIEIMGKHSNIMLVDADKNNIIDSIKHISSAQNRVRSILPGQPYVLPPAQEKVNPLELDGEGFIRLIDFNQGRIDKQIVSNLTGFSTVIAKELVSRAGLGERSNYERAFLEMKQQIEEGNLDPSTYINGDKEDFHVLNLTSVKGEKETFADVQTMLDQFYSGKAQRDRVRQQAKDLHRFLKTEKEKNERKLVKQENTIQKSEDAEKYQRLGELLTAHLHLVKQGDRSVEVTDYYDPEQKKVTIELNQQKSPSDNAQSYYKTYQKLKHSKVHMETEMKKTKAEIDYLDSLLQQIDSARVEDLEEIREELLQEGYLKKKTTTKQKNKSQKPEPEQFAASDGTVIFVGKNNKQNDHLTNRIARRDEIWLHTKDIPGSHVIIRSEDPSETTILEAAQLAAWFSKSRESSSVPVDYTKVRHVKKPSGAKPGFVTYDNQKTVFVTPEERKIREMKEAGRS
ncbi:NFACT RNA binding domain-containing protein [Aciduricibacillus chroicocephali]|uniref:Rqc2 homolog RqcH n=1 Tax=Aciduricibacillus chroicocephali TaxID=3054939 RepID=A0ABY9KXX6_9BACI|nr:NFACT RNA binding domain-containing protein [Bacillaceae bacterium 44XB]